MKLAHILQQSISSIFDLYYNYGKKLYPFSFGYALITLLLSAILAALACSIATFFYPDPFLMYASFWEKIFLSPVNYARWQDLTTIYSLFFLALYAVYIKKILSGSEIGTSHFFSSIQYSLSSFFTVFFIYTLFFILIYKDFFSEQVYDAYNNSYGRSLWRQWLNSLTDLLRVIVAITASFYIVKRNYSELKINAYNSILGILILSFALNACISKILMLLNKYIFYPFNLLFYDSYIPLVFFITAAVFFLSWFYMGLAACIHYPVQHSHIGHTVRKSMLSDPEIIDQQDEG